MLIHGRMLPMVLKIKECDIRFFGHSSDTRHSYMPLVDCWGSGLPDSIMNGFLGLDAERFREALFALKYFLTGKDADVPVEFKYLLLMSCVDAMDGETIGQLKEPTTAALLGVSTDAAFLFNGMRNKLTHRAMGYRKAFQAFLAEDLKLRKLELEPALEPCLEADGALDFARLWLRLCERLDAFWCAYLKVPAEQANERYAAGVSLMPSVDLARLDAAITVVLREQAEKRQQNREAESKRRDELQTLQRRVAVLESELKAARDLLGMAD